jgi:hypothetical protein
MSKEGRSSGKGYGYWYPDTYGSRTLKFSPESQGLVVVSADDTNALHSTCTVVNIPIAVLTELLAEAGYSVKKEEK